MLKKIRRLIQIICFFLLPSLFIQILQSMEHVISAILYKTATFESLIFDLLIVITATMVTALAGRFFCGWICAFGSLGDAIYGFRKLISKKNFKLAEKADTVLKSIKYIILGSLVLFVWSLQIVSVPSGSSPWDLFGMLLSFQSLPSIQELTESWSIAFILLTAIVVCSAFIERFFCRYLCPLGAYFSIVSRLRPYAIRKDRENCGSCSLCTKKCSMGIQLGKVDTIQSGECINCMECVVNCPSSNAAIPIQGSDAVTVITGTATAALIGGAVYLGNYMDTNTSATSTLSADTTQVAGEILASSVNQYTDGTYEGSGSGFRGTTTVEVTVTGGIITEIEVVDTNDDDRYIDRAVNQMIPTMITTQSADVDTVSGATYSSNGLIEAVSNALLEAGGEEVNILEENTEDEINNEQSDLITEESSDEIESTDSENDSINNLDNGIYEGTGTGFRGETSVSVVVEDGKITDIVIEDYQDDRKFFEKASDKIINEILENQSVSVDAVSGATYSSYGIMGAVADALNLEYDQPEAPAREGKHRR